MRLSKVWKLVHTNEAGGVELFAVVTLHDDVNAYLQMKFNFSVTRPLKFTLRTRTRDVKIFFFGKSGRRTAGQKRSKIVEIRNTKQTKIV